jgi:DNA repair protein RadC
MKIQSSLGLDDKPVSSSKSYAVRQFKLVSEVVAETSSAYANTPEATLEVMNGAFDDYPDQEQFWVIMLNIKNRVIGRQLISIGTLNGTMVSTREVFRAAIMQGAAAIIICHNHPSGDPAPSGADIKVTRLLREAGMTLGIGLLDHVVIGELAYDPAGLGYYSFRASGMI